MARLWGALCLSWVLKDDGFEQGRCVPDRGLNSIRRGAEQMAGALGDEAGKAGGCLTRKSLLCFLEL